MCEDCEGTSIVLPVGDPGANGDPGIGYNGTNGIEEHVVFDTSLSVTYTVNDFLNSVPVDSLGSPDFSQFRTISYFIFPGTNNLQGISPNKAYIIANIITNTWLVRIRDENNVIIAETTTISSPTPLVIDMGAITYIPSNLGIITIEVFPLDVTDITSSIEIKSLSLIQE